MPTAFDGTFSFVPVVNLEPFAVKIVTTEITIKNGVWEAYAAPSG